MKAPLKRAVTIYSSWELFLMQHPKRLQLLHLGCQEKRYFYGCSSKSWHGGKLRKLLDVSFDSPHVSPCIHVPGLHVPCAFFSIPADSRARAPCPTPSISGADEVGGKHWLGKPFVYTSGGWRGSVSIFCSGAQPPPPPPPPQVVSWKLFSQWLAVVNWPALPFSTLCWDSALALFECKQQASGFHFSGRGLRARGEPHRVLILPVFVVPLVFCSSLGDRFMYRFIEWAHCAGFI